MASHKKTAHTALGEEVLRKDMNTYKRSAKIKRDDDSEPRKKPATKSERKRAQKQALSKTGKVLFVIIGCAAMLLSVTAMACSGVLNQATSSEEYELTGGIAATVNGVNITEDTITEQIMSTRSSYGYDSDEDWAQYLVDASMTPESYREQIIDSYVQQALLQQAISENNVTVSDEDIQEAWDEAVSSYGDEESFLSLVSAMGYDEDSYKEMLASSLQEEKLEELVAPIEEASDEEILAYFNENFDTYNDARRSENLLISVDSETTDDEKAEAQAEAQEILDKINAGEMTFEEAVEEHSDDTASAEDGGDVGWDKLTSFVTEYQSALNELTTDQISGVVETSYGYHLIKCTDVLNLEGEATEIDQLPDEYQEYFANVIETENQSTAYSEWLEEYTDAADIQINDMPENVPYNVSLDGVIPTSEQTGSGSASATTEEDESDA